MDLSSINRQTKLPEPFHIFVQDVFIVNCVKEKYEQQSSSVLFRSPLLPAESQTSKPLLESISTVSSSRRGLVLHNDTLNVTIM